MKTNHSSLGKYISIIHRQGRIFINEKMGAYGINGSQSMFLISLFHHDGIRQEDLCHRLSIDKGTTARAIKKLEDSGLVTRERDSKDKRAYNLYLTEKAHNLKPKFLETLNEWTDALAESMTEEQKKSAFKLLEIMADNAVGKTLCMHNNKKQENIL